MKSLLSVFLMAGALSTVAPAQANVSQELLTYFQADYEGEIRAERITENVSQAARIIQAEIQMIEAVIGDSMDENIKLPDADRARIQQSLTKLRSAAVEASIGVDRVVKVREYLSSDRLVTVAEDLHLLELGAESTIREAAKIKTGWLMARLKQMRFNIAKIAGDLILSMDTAAGNVNQAPVGQVLGLQKGVNKYVSDLNKVLESIKGTLLEAKPGLGYRSYDQPASTAGLTDIKSLEMERRVLTEFSETIRTQMKSGNLSTWIKFKLPKK